MKREYIIRNSLICKKCEDEIESTHVHDFKFCKCGAVAVDGGREYLRRAGDFKNAADTSCCIDGDIAEIIRKHKLNVDFNPNGSGFKISHKRFAVCYIGSMEEVCAWIPGFSIGVKSFRADLVEELSD